LQAKYSRIKTYEDFVASGETGLFVRLLTAAKARNGNQLVPRGLDGSEIGAETPISFVLKGECTRCEWSFPSGFVTDECDKGWACRHKER